MSFIPDEAQAQTFAGGSRMSTSGMSRRSYSASSRIPRRSNSYGALVIYRTPSARTEQPSGSEENEAISQPQVETTGARPTVSGSRAVLRNGVAYAPSAAPESVKRLIWAVNGLRRKPYKWGGGHGSFYDSGYDCSGTVSFALHNAGVLGSPMPSSGFLDYGQRGRGRWITVFSRRGHTFAMVAGLRLDTTNMFNGADVGPRWHTTGRDSWGFQARHPAGL